MDADGERNRVRDLPVSSSRGRHDNEGSSHELRTLPQGENRAESDDSSAVTVVFTVLTVITQL